MKKRWLFLFLICLSSFQLNAQENPDSFYQSLKLLSPEQLWIEIENLNYDDIPLIAPEDYYVNIDFTDLRASLHELIDDHENYPYSFTKIPLEKDWKIDVWDILVLADQHPESENQILDFYLNGTFNRVLKGPGEYDREHLWPQSRGFKNKISPANTDCHHIVVTKSSYNSSRSNSFFANIKGTEGIKIKPTVLNLGLGGTGDPNFGIDIEDEVDDHKRRRNTIVYLFQGNRNPFIDHPEWVELIWQIDGESKALSDKSYSPDEQPAILYWINSSSNVRHNSSCRYYGKTKKGHYSVEEEGKACGICGG